MRQIELNDCLQLSLNSSEKKNFHIYATIAAVVASRGSESGRRTIKSQLVSLLKREEKGFD